jgi:hypothetical protein
VDHSDITKPGVQKPHCEPWQSTMACCTGCRVCTAWCFLSAAFSVALSSLPAALALNWPLRSSTVNSALPCSVGRNWMQALTVCRLSPSMVPGASVPVASSPMTTVQAPQSPSLQPSLVPVQRASSRSQSSTERVGWTPVTSTIFPRWKKRIGCAG